MDLNKMMNDKIMRIILIITIIIIPTYVVFVYVSLSPGVNSSVHVDDEMYYSKKVVNNVTTITITTYITNEGVGDSGDLRLKIFVEDSDGISTVEGEKNIGTIDGKKTEEVQIDVIVVESEWYNVKAKLFEDGKEIVDSSGGFKAPTSNELSDSGGSFEPYTEESESDKEEFSAPGFGSVELIIAAALILIILNTRKHIKTKRSK